MIRLLVSLSLWWCLCAAVLAGQLLDVVAEPEFDTLRISLQVSGPTQFRYSLLDKPDRLLIELSDTEAATNVTPAAVRAAPINNLRLNRNGKNLKLVFELSSSVLVKTYRLKAAKNQSDRIVLELTGFKTVSAKSPSSAPKGAGADEDRVAEAKPLAQKDLSAQSEPAAQTERLAQRDVLVQKEPAAQKQPSAQQPKLQPTAGQKEATAKPLPQAPEKRSQVDVSRPVNEPVNEPAPPPPATLDKESKQSILLPLGKVPTVLDPPKAPKTADTPAQESHAPIRGRKIIVALDAGHGGKDTGAVGPKGVREKDVVLAIARELSAQLNQDGRFKVVMTRADDKFIPLKGRRDKARKLKADVFISIHADAFVTAQARGASVFALSQRGATSEMARFLAEHENSSDLLGSVGGVSLEDKDEILAGVLVDLSMTATLANSLDLGARVLKELGRMAPLHNHSVEQAGFVVLKSPDVPSILVETGFISNPQEAAALNSPAYRQKIAQAIYRGVHSYFAMQGPELAQPSQPTSAESRGSQSADTRAPVPAVRPDTPKIDPRAESRGRPEAVTIKPVTSAVSGKSPGAPGPVAAASTGKPQSHRVIKGDTLEKIARHYGVTQKAIIQANGMPNGVVKLGQTLIIPVP